MTIRLTKKHFEFLAHTMRQARPSAGGQELAGLDLAAYRLADALRQTNPRFDEAKFLEACAYGQYELDLEERTTT